MCLLVKLADTAFGFARQYIDTSTTEYRIKNKKIKQIKNILYYKKTL